MALTPDDLNRLEDILRHAFPTLNGLKLMLGHMGKNLEDLTIPDSLPHAVYILVREKAVPQNWVLDLVLGALEGNPTNPDLQHFSLYALLVESGLSLRRLSLLSGARNVIGSRLTLDDFVSAIENLPDVPKPILRMAIQLSKHQEALQIHPSLIKWVTCIEEVYKLPPDWKNKDPVLQPLRDSQALEVFLIPDEPNQKVYTLKIFVRAGEQHVCLHKQEGVVINLEGDISAKMQSVLSSALWWVLKNDENLYGLPVEFFLPFPLLSQAVDQVDLHIPGSPTKLCFEHPVVVRSLERVMNPYMYGLCKRRWGFFDACADPEQQYIHFSYVTSARALSALNTWRKILQKCQWICVGFWELPDDNSETIKLLGALIGTGIPILVWARHTSTHEVFHNLLHRHGISDLPISIHEERQAGCDAGEDHIGNHLSFLWDDPRQYPPQDILSSSG